MSVYVHVHFGLKNAKNLHHFMYMYILVNLPVSSAQSSSAPHAHAQTTNNCLFKQNRVHSILKAYTTIAQWQKTPMKMRQLVVYCIFKLLF